VALHHAVQRAGFDFFLEFDSFEGRVVAGESVAEACAGEVPVGEQDRDSLLWANSGDDDFGVGDVVDVWARLQWWQWVAWPRAAANCVDGCLVQARPPPVVEDVAGFGVGTLGQHSRFPGAYRPPTPAEGGLDLRSLLFKS
jgi:hypothetical protein